MKLWLFMPEMLDRKQGAMPKINWNKNGKINECMGNTRKSKGKDVDHQITNQWLKTAEHKSKTGHGFIIGA